MQLAVINHSENYPMMIDEYPLLLPAILLAPEILYASDYAQLFEHKRLLTSHNVHLSYKSKRPYTQETDLQGRIDQILKSLDNLEKMGRKDLVDKILSGPEGSQKAVEDAGRNLQNSIDKFLADLKLNVIEEVNRKASPGFIEIVKTRDDLNQENTDENLVYAIGKVLLNYDVIPLLPDFVKFINMLKADTTKLGVIQNRLEYHESSLCIIPSLKELNAMELADVRNELTASASEFIGHIEYVSRFFRNITLDNPAIPEQDIIYLKISRALSDLHNTISDNKHIKRVIDNHLADEFYELHFFVASARRLIELYSSAKMINDYVGQEINEMVKNMNPFGQILGFAVERLRPQKSKSVLQGNPDGGN